EGRHSSEAANPAACRRAPVDILFVAEFVIVIGRVVALAHEKWLKTILAAGVYGKKLLAIFAREIIKQLRIGCGRHRHRRVRNVSSAGDGGRSNARGGFVFGVSIEHEKVEVLCWHLARERVRTDQTVAIAAERKMHRHMRVL